MIGEAAPAQQAPRPPATGERGAHQQHRPVARQPLRVHVRRQGRAAAAAPGQVGLHRPGGDLVHRPGRITGQEIFARVPVRSGRRPGRAGR